MPSPLVVDGVTLQVTVVRRRVRHVNARLAGDSLRVSAPPGIPPAELETIVRDLARTLMRRVRAARVNEDGRALEVARSVANRFPEPPTVREVRFVTTQRARWGSYSQRTGAIRLHAALREMPAWVLEAVVAHELAHIVHPNHSAAFWQLATAVCPATERARAFLEGVSWTARRWNDLPPVEQSLLL